MVHSSEGLQKDIQPVLQTLEKADIVRRIWAKDHTVWKPAPNEITDRLGWLTVLPEMQSRLAELRTFAEDIRREGFRHVILLGMGGSSLGAEVFRRTFTRAGGFPELIVFDSALPESVLDLTRRLDPERTLFIVSSKSGSTIELVCLTEYFWKWAASTVGESGAGARFAAITDPGTPLERLASERGFRRTFLNPADIGGRYSVLSYFGLVPAMLMGLNCGVLLDRAGRMAEACRAGQPLGGNPGAWLGAVIGGMAERRKDKLTLITSPKIGPFGLWLEQLLAESLGKEGRGVVPVAGEPLVGADRYGEDRLFVCLRLEGDENASVDEAVGALRSSGRPVIIIRLADPYDLGAEFFRWEFATAVAGAVMGVQPFNQPNVQQAKDATHRVLAEFSRRGRLPPPENGEELNRLFEKLETRGRYLGIMAFVPESHHADRALGGLRRRVVERYGAATIAGYGPRYLHSSGQLYKGGPDTGVFLQFTLDHAPDVPIPGKPYTFGVLADAQAIGDFETLRALGRPVSAVRLPAGTAEEIGQAIAAMPIKS